MQKALGGFVRAKLLHGGQGWTNGRLKNERENASSSCCPNLAGRLRPLQSRIWHGHRLHHSYRPTHRRNPHT
ncbi:hypothetical protein CC2G_001431 [Coprinopsis cinerea AmutBmut pab1-1]|nr:hypothetical protein CC2G_001431 [Coprinopsis cinerea AmutBmut pab1-1]